MKTSRFSTIGNENGSTRANFDDDLCAFALGEHLVVVRRPAIFVYTRPEFRIRS